LAFVILFCFLFISLSLSLSPSPSLSPSLSHFLQSSVLPNARGLMTLLSLSLVHDELHSQTPIVCQVTQGQFTI
jgi:hypothetical protein